MATITRYRRCMSLVLSLSAALALVIPAQQATPAAAIGSPPGGFIIPAGETAQLTKEKGSFREPSVALAEEKRFFRSSRRARWFGL
jgi:hypothetical protein